MTMMMSICLLGLRRTLGFGNASRGWLIKESVLFFNVLGLIPATLPAIPPVADEKSEAESINLHARLKTDAQISKVHLVLFRVRQQEAQMTCYGEE